MRMVFAYGTKLKVDDKGLMYTGGGFNDNVWKRYLSITPNVSLIARVESTKFPQQTAVEKFNRLPTDRIHVVGLHDSRQSLRAFFNPILHAQNRRQIREAVERADFVIARLPDSTGATAIHYCRQYKKPYLIELVGCPWDSLWNHGSLKGKVLAPFGYLQTRALVKRAGWVVYVSRHFLQRRYPTRGRQLSCPDVILDEPKEEVLEQRLKRIEESSRTGNFVLGLIGSLDVAYRGHETAIRTLAHLGGQYYCLRFLGAGSSAQWKKLASKLFVVDRVEFSGQLPSGDAVLRWIDDIDILIMPTRQETLGRAVIEAMGRGCPVIGSIETAIPEQIGSDCVCAAKDYQAFAEIIRRMTRDPGYLKACAQENFYRSFKYASSRSDKLRGEFIDSFLRNELPNDTKAF